VKVAASHVEALNHALSDVPEDRVRIHICWGNYEGPHVCGQAALEQRIREICQTRVRFGYRRVHVLLKREGWEINAKKTYRIYKELGMQLRNKTPKRRAKAKLREDRADAVRPNDVWAMDFVEDQLATGRKIRVLTVVDTFSRYVPALDARFSYRGEDVVATLDHVCRRIGYPDTIRVDQGSEFISRDMDLWAYQRGVTLDFSRPGRPTDNPLSRRSMGGSGQNA
jgi:putative transposase